MNTIECDAMRDLIPDLAAGRLSPARARAAEAHVAACADCAAERAIVDSVLRQRVEPPAGLDARVLAGLAAPRAPRVPVRLALAATIVVSIGAGAILWRSGGAPAPPPAESGTPAIVWPASDEPLLHGAPSLGDLSTEELETLLEEWDS